MKCIGRGVDPGFAMFGSTQQICFGAEKGDKDALRLQLRCQDRQAQREVEAAVDGGQIHAKSAATTDEDIWGPRRLIFQNLWDSNYLSHRSG